jgi:hypothetical protein
MTLSTFHAVRGGFVAALLLAALGAAGCGKSAPAPQAATPRPPSPREKAEALLAAADAESNAAAAEQVRRVRAFFAARRANAGAFAAEATNFSNTTSWVTEQLGLDRPGFHADRVRAAFGRHVMTAEEVRTEVRAAAEAYARELDAIDARFLVRLAADVPDLTGAALPAPPDGVPGADAAAGRVADAAGPVVGRGVAQEVGVQVVSASVARLLAAGLVDAGAFAGLGLSGLADNWAFMIALDAAVGEAISWVLRQLGLDPEDNVADLARKAVGEVERAAVDGGDGLARAFAAAAAQRAAARKAVADDLLAPKPDKK